MKPIDRGIIFFLKYPRKGKVKTRLAAKKGETFTLKLYECFIADMLRKLGTAASEAFHVHLFLTPGETIPGMFRWLATIGEKFPIHAQEGENLGERMVHAFEQMFRMEYETCILIGSDLPDLPARVLEDALRSLTVSDAVIGPTWDGGYYLLGFRRDTFCRDVFHGIRWSTGTVFRETMKIFRRKGLQVKILPRWRDVDDADDLEAFMERNKNSDFKDSETMRFLTAGG